MSDINSSPAYKHLSFALLIALAFLIAFIAFSNGSSSAIDFGDDSHEFANNNQCSDTRFRGPGMGNIAGSETASDATDCAALFEEGAIFLASETANLAILAIDFGNDEGAFPNDDECDDPRFEGSGAFSGGDDFFGDATDCRTTMYQGTVTLAEEVEALFQDGIDFGDDLGIFANDGECDDTRFSGPGMADSSTFDSENINHDASDCLDLYNEGLVALSEVQIIDGIDFGDDFGSWPNDGECDDPRFEGELATGLGDEYADATDCSTLYSSGDVTYLGENFNGAGVFERGVLESGDEVLGETGEYLDSYFFEGTANQTAVFDLRSAEFDTYLIILGPDGEQFENDDYEGDMSRSLVSTVLESNGTYEVMVTSYDVGETGSYTLEINTEDELDATINLDEVGQLQTDDEILASGEYMDSYEFSALPGQMVTVSLVSDDFDAYLILQSPSGEIFEDDDSLGSGTDSLVEFEASEFGTYEIWVTSYATEETGAYTLQVLQEVMEIPVFEDRDLVDIEIGGTANGYLEQGDMELDTGEFEDLFAFTAEAGDNIVVDLNSTDFDTYLTLITPSGEEITNDDFEGSLEQSQIEITLQQGGRYRVHVSSYAAEESGEYLLSVYTQAAGAVDQFNNSEGKVFGVFAGIADYPGTGNDLSLTDEDAIRTRDALIRGAGMDPADAITLLDEDATRENLDNAIADLAGRMSPEDTFVLFFSGHGDQVTRADGFESSDPDGQDETIELYDSAVLDNELNDMLAQVNVGKTLIVLDSCFSGGFSKDVISVPGRMGLFSSEEDVTSQVAFKFQAGGYLSFFFEEALTETYADSDQDGSLNAIELSQYLHERFRADVKSFGGENYVTTSGPQSNYQHLVVDRGSLDPFDILF